jgi:hypothetical protein
VRRGLGAIAALLTLFAIIVLGGTLLLLIAAGNEFDRRIDSEVDRVHQQFESDFDTIRQEVRDELDRRLPEPTP